MDVTFVLIGFSLIYVAQLVNDFRDSGFKDLDQKRMMLFSRN